MSFTSQMIQYSNVSGGTSPIKGGTYIYGPYLRAFPENPYYGVAGPMPVSQAQAAARDLVGGALGWAYYDGSAGGEPVFYANSDTAGVGENDF